MYAILVNDDNSLYATKKQRIVQRSKLIDTFYFLVKPTYNGHDMSNCTVLLEYLKPTSRKYKTEILQLSNERYKDYLKYILPVDTEFTEEAGKIELQLSFIYVDIDADGKQIQKVRKTAPALKVDIIPISAWSDIIPDSALSAIDQRIIKVDAQIKALDDMNAALNNAKADNISYENDKLQLIANGNKIGDAINIKSCDGTYDEDGVPVVDFYNYKEPETGDKDELNNIVEF